MHEAYITRVKNLRNHSNADRLRVCECFGNTTIVGLDIEENELVLYIPTDLAVGVEFAEKNNLLRKKDEQGNNVGGFLDPINRNVTTIKLRGEKSDGLILKLKSLSDFTDIAKLKEGDRITILNKITIVEKYVPKRANSNNGLPNRLKEKKVKIVEFPLFQEHLDTNQLVYNMGDFKEGDTCYITLKMHGTSSRVAHTVRKNNKQNFIQKLLKLKTKPKKSWDYVSGTRRVVLTDFNGGFYGSDKFRQEWHDFFVGKLPKGFSVYGEIVGYTDTGKLIMSECDNSKTKDKEFIKQYGKTTKFTYGCEECQNDFYVYRMTMTNEDGEVIEIPWEQVKNYCEKFGVKHVPEFEKFLFTTREDLMERVAKFADGADPVGKNHIREGIVVRIDNKQKFTAFKHKNFSFKVLEGIIKSDAVEPDMEESQDL